MHIRRRLLLCKLTLFSSLAGIEMFLMRALNGFLFCAK